MNTRKATFKDLVNKKIKKDENKLKTKDIYIGSMEATLTFKKPKEEIVLEVLDSIGDGKNVSLLVEQFKKVIYHSCEMLQDTELHKELEVLDPFEVVDLLFEVGEVLEIGEQLMDLMDIEGNVKEIKN